MGSCPTTGTGTSSPWPADLSNSIDGFRDGQNPAGADKPDYEYDASGNMTRDWNKGITAIRYNHLNLPVYVEFGSNLKQIPYLYNALGAKVGRVVDDRSVSPALYQGTDYLDGFQYLGGELQFFPTAEGYVSVTGGTAFDYVYNYTDHLGNIRLGYSKPQTEPLKILEESHYYPFGMKHLNYGSQKNRYVLNPNKSPMYAVLEPVERSDYQYKYNGKEYQDELGLNMYDMGARNYMPDIGRWGNMDELAEDFSDLSPYNFSNNSPVNFSDPSGLSPEKPENFASTFIDKNGKVIEHRNDGDDNVYLVGRDWNKGDSKKGLGILGKEKAGVEYTPGLTYQINENGYLDYFDLRNSSKISGAITPIGGAFDIFGLWDALASSTEDQPGVALLTFLLTKGKKGKMSTTLRVSIGKNSKKMTLGDIEELLGKNWHQNGAKKAFLNKFSKLLKGDTNADLY